jgi:CRP-like cAMP-binding protein
MIAIMSPPLIDLLHGLPATEREYAASKRIFREGDKVLALHQVVEGQIHLVRHNAGGAPLILQRASRQAILAEASLFAERYHCDAVAVVPTRTRAIEKALLLDALKRMPGLAEAWAAHLAREIQAARLRVEILSLRTVAERLEAWIAVNAGQIPGKGEWKNIASEIGTSPEALYREIAKRRGKKHGRYGRLFADVS